ncbi:hypothetical protein T190115A13A_10396 [Tenacibaculum sp. 190524A02b]|uniref:Uncharacterized protein n=1 Tax=Tenacibaculum vairaonense TaxID=3137860 RepID=A0ABM9PKQ0_9FLAO
MANNTRNKLIVLFLVIIYYKDACIRILLHILLNYNSTCLFFKKVYFC